ncbi:MAG TPA: MFS transporter [Pelolinea sp.]|nr:MFS transporter [Pelolinea sp.]
MTPMREWDISKRARAYFDSPTGRRVAMWLAYFIYWAGVAAYLPYISLYYESIGLQGGQIGQLSSIPHFITLVSSILIAFFSDKSRRHKMVLSATSIGITVVLFLYPSARSFAAFIPIVLAYSILFAPSNAILDETTLNTLDNPGNYGKIRVGGTIGWGIMVLVTGYLIDHLNIGLMVIFYVNIFFNLLFLLIILIMPKTHPRSSISQEQVSAKKVLDMLLQPGFLLFLLVIIIWGIGESSISGFLFLHIKHLGGSSTLMGTALAVSLVGEILVFTFADKIQARLNSQKMLLMAFVVLFAWLTGLSLIRNPNAIPLFQIFGGAGYALLQSGSVAYVNQRAPREIGTTAQAVRGGVFSGLGVGVGSIISGLIYEGSGSVELFRIMSFIVLGGFFFGIVAYMIERRRQTSS